MAPTTLTLIRRLNTQGRFRHAEALLTIYETRHIGRAAEKMGMTQPALSQLVAELERLFETKLLLRHARGVQPLPTLEDLVPALRQILAAAEDAAERVAARFRSQDGPIRVATSAAAAHAYLGQVLPRITAGDSNLNVQVSQLSGDELETAFVSERYDIICCRRKEVVPASWAYQRCMSDHLIIACGPDHPLTRRKQIKASDLRDVVWLNSHASTVSHKQLEELANTFGWSATRQFQVVTNVPTLIAQLLLDSKAVALVPKSIMSNWLNNNWIVEIPFKLAVPVNSLGFYWQEEQVGNQHRHFRHALISAVERCRLI